MTRTFTLAAGDPSSWAPALDAAATALAAGRLVVMPTETVYGIAARPDLPAATARLFEAKGRPRDLALPVLAATAAAALALGEPGPAAAALARLWPGPLTLIVPRSDASRAFDLGDRPASVGLRVPAFAPALALLSRTGPLAVTSANPSGRPPIGDPASLVAAFGEAVDVYLVVAPDRGSAPDALAGPASTVVDCTGARPRVVRTGPLGPAELGAALRESGLPADSVDCPS